MGTERSDEMRPEQESGWLVKMAKKIAGGSEAVASEIADTARGGKSGEEYAKERQRQSVRGKTIEKALKDAGAD